MVKTLCRSSYVFEKHENQENHDRDARNLIGGGKERKGGWKKRKEITSGEVVMTERTD